MIDMFMTRQTYRNNIKPLFFGVTFMVMILFCAIITVGAFKCCWVWYFPSYYSISNGHSCFESHRISLLSSGALSFCSLLAYHALIMSFTGGFTFFCFEIYFVSFFMKSFAFWTLSIFFSAICALILQTIQIRTAFSEFRKWFYKFTMRTLFAFKLAFQNKFGVFTTVNSFSWAKLFKLISTAGLSVCLFSFFCMYISSANRVFTYLTSTAIAIFMISVLVKFRERFDLFAFGALLGYDGRIHNVSYSDVMAKARNERHNRYDWPVLYANLISNPYLVKNNSYIF